MSLKRTILAGGGVAVLGGCWLGPLPELARGSFAAHMTMHMGVVAVAAPLLSLGIAGSGWDPVRRTPWMFAAIPASVIELIVVWSWHAPALHHWARHSTVGIVLEQGSFLASGLLLWLAGVGGGRSELADRAGAGMAGLLLTSMHMTLLGALLALSPRALYELHDGRSGLPAIEDQHLGGAIMLLAGGVSYLAGGVGLGAVLLCCGSRAGAAKRVGSSG